MRYTGLHRTLYEYTEPVYLQGHTIRLRPRSDPGQVVHAYSMEIDPAPDGHTEALDAWGNNVSWAWFSGKHETLEITTRFVVERTRFNPFDFIVPTAEARLIPPDYGDDERAGLAPFLNGSDIGESVKRLADETAEATGRNITDFALELSNRINASCKMIVRPEGDPWKGQATLDAGEGSCRDMAMLYVEACRHVGIASRFVSGYVQEREKGEPRELHAWAGVYLPGGGWRGFDATQGLAVSNGHITVASAAFPAGAAPVTGSFRATGAQAKLSSFIELDVYDG